MKIILISLFLFRISANYSQWISLNSGTSTDLKSVFFINIQTGFAAGAGGTMLKTTNGGNNWISLNTGLSVSLNSVYFISLDTGLACGNSGKIILTTNSGTQWNLIASGVTGNLNAISFYDNNKGVCSGSDGTLLWTTNGGLNWTTAVSGFTSEFYGMHMISSNAAYACGVNGIFAPLVAKTTNGGVNWSYTSFYLNTNEGNLRAIRFLDTSEAFAVSNVWDGQGGISHTTNGGLNWTTQLYPSALNGLDFAGPNTGYTVGRNGFILKTTNRGTSWTVQTSGISGILRSVDFTDSITGYAAGDGGVILKTTNGGITALKNSYYTVPEKFTLYQNYPNPFNPLCKIKFDIPKSSFTVIRIHDIMGREISTLVDEKLQPGTYEVNFDGLNLPSGVYFYKIEAGIFRDTKKLVLVK